MFWLILFGVVCWLIGWCILLQCIDFVCLSVGQCSDYYQFFGVFVYFDWFDSWFVFNVVYFVLLMICLEQVLKIFLCGVFGNLFVCYWYDIGWVVKMCVYFKVWLVVEWFDFDMLVVCFDMMFVMLWWCLCSEG